MKNKCMREMLNARQSAKRHIYLALPVENDMKSIFLLLQDSTIGTPVTLRVDPKGYILYWKDQIKVRGFLCIHYWYWFVYIMWNEGYTSNCRILLKCKLCRT